MKVDVDPDDVQKLDADGRGRVYLGTEYADMDGVEVAVLDTPSEREPANWCGEDDCPHCQGFDKGPVGAPDCPRAVE